MLSFYNAHVQKICVHEARQDQVATTRINISLDEKIKAKAEKASALLGESLSSYIVNLMNEDASKVIARHDSLTVRDDIFDRFMGVCAEVGKPNRSLEDAVKSMKTQGSE